MNPFDGEIFERVINESFYTIVKSGPLHEPITSMIC